MTGEKFFELTKGLVILALLASIIGLIFLLGRIGARRDAVIEEIGKEAVGSTIDGGSGRMVRIKYEVHGRTYIEGIGKPFDFIQPNEQYRMKYLPDDPESMIVFFDRPYISEEGEYSETNCTSISKSVSVVDFEYRVAGRTIKRETLYRNHQLSASIYKVLYRNDNPEIGYLVKR